METWQQVRSYICSKYRVRSDKDCFMSLDFDMGNGRTQLVMIGCVDAGGYSVIRLDSPFAKWGNVPSDLVLRAAEPLLVGIRVVAGLLTATHSQLLATINEAEIDRIMIDLSSTADTLEQALLQGDTW
jgi:hypothetical protein